MRASFFILMSIGYAIGLSLVSSSYLYVAFIERVSKEFPMATQVDLGWSLATAGFLLLLGMAFVGYFGFSDDRHAGALWAAGTTIVVVLLIGIQTTLPRFSRYFIVPPQELA
jgi:hypothetical protein